MGDKYLVTGATGFVGSYIVRKLVMQGKNVHILTKEEKLNWRLSDLSSKIHVHKADLLDKKLLVLVKKINPTYIFHLAAFGSLPNEEDMGNLIDVNLKGTINLISAAKQNKFKLFINTGSSSEYGVKKGSMKETDLPCPINDYGVTKAASTLYTYKEAVRNNLPLITFRLFSVYGPYEQKTRLIPTVILSALANNPINVSNPTHVRDFVYIDDVADAYLSACKARIIPGEIFNIGTGKQHSVGEVVKRILQFSQSKSRVAWGTVRKQSRQIESADWRANTRKSKKLLKWQARYSLHQGLKKSLVWFKENGFLYE